MLGCCSEFRHLLSSGSFSSVLGLINTEMKLKKTLSLCYCYFSFTVTYLYTKCSITMPTTKTATTTTPCLAMLACNPAVTSGARLDITHLCRRKTKSKAKQRTQQTRINPDIKDHEMNKGNLMYSHESVEAFLW